MTSKVKIYQKVTYKTDQGIKIKIQNKPVNRKRSSVLQFIFERKNSRSTYFFKMSSVVLIGFGFLGHISWKDQN